MDEPDRVQRVGTMLAAVLGELPVVGGTDVHQHARRRASASLPARNFAKRETRHTRKRLGNKAGSENV